jgi:prepilin-type processing-associated H-X9-DG protein
LAAAVILAILAALLFGAIGKVRAASEQAQCVARLREVNRATLSYAADHEETLPSSLNPADRLGDADGIWYHYRELVLPYLGGLGPQAAAKIFTCPADHELAPDSPSYLFNGGNEFAEALPGLAGKRLVAILHPARTVLIAEAGAFHPYSWHDPRRGSAKSYNDAKNVVSFCDGHVEFLPIFQPPNHEYAAEADPPSRYGYQWSPE